MFCPAAALVQACAGPIFLGFETGPTARPTARSSPADTPADAQEESLVSQQYSGRSAVGTGGAGVKAATGCECAVHRLVEVRAGTGDFVDTQVTPGGG